jgi:hypothetical protein
MHGTPETTLEVDSKEQILIVSFRSKIAMIGPDLAVNISECLKVTA